MRTIPEWVRPGADVVIRSNGWGRRFGRITKINKVHKSGNFTLEGDSQQWRPHYEYASQTGSSGYHMDTCWPLTDETRADMEREARIYAAKKLVSDEATRLEKLSRTDSDELLAEAYRIVASRKEARSDARD